MVRDRPPVANTAPVTPAASADTAALDKEVQRLAQLIRQRDNEISILLAKLKKEKERTAQPLDSVSAPPVTVGALAPRYVHHHACLLRRRSLLTGQCGRPRYQSRLMQPLRSFSSHILSVACDCAHMP